MNGNGDPRFLNVHKERFVVGGETHTREFGGIIGIAGDVVALTLRRDSDDSAGAFVVGVLGDDHISIVGNREIIGIGEDTRILAFHE